MSANSVEAIRTRESATIEERKTELARMCSDIAHIGFARVADTIGTARCRDAVIGSAVSVDKLLALTGQLPGVQVAVVMPTPQDREERRAIHDRLDDIARRLNARKDPS
jgi:hypothetical protein